MPLTKQQELELLRLKAQALSATTSSTASNFKDNPYNEPFVDTPLQRAKLLVDKFNQGIPFSDEYITDPIAAGYAALATGQNPVDLYNQARQMTNSDLSAQNAAHPVASNISQLGGTLAGALTGGKLINAIAPTEALNAASTFAKANPWTATGLAGSGGNALYSAGQAEGNASDRAKAAFWPGVAGALLGMAGYGMARGVGNLLERPGVKNFVSDLMNPPISSPGGILGEEAASSMIPPDMTPMKAAGILDEEALAKLQQGKVLPMTAGQRTQNVNTQRMERTALENRSMPMIEAQNLQQQAGYKPFTGILGEGQILNEPELNLRAQSELEKAASTLQNQFKTLKGQEDVAWDAARQIGGGVGISASALKDTFINNAELAMAERQVRVGDIPALDDHLDELRNILKSSDENGTKFDVTSVKLNELEKWKTRLNSLIGDADPTKKNSLTVMKNVARQYGEFINNLSDDAIINGDQAAIEAFKKARGLSVERFKFYDADSNLQDLLDNHSFSGTQLVNLIYGANKITGKGDNGNITGTLIRLAGDKSPEMQEALKRGALAKILSNSLTGTVNPVDTSMKILDFKNMKKGLGNLMTQKETFGSIFDETEQEYFKTLYKDLELVSSFQPGAINSSGTGARMADFMTGMGKVINNPVFKRVPGVGMGTTGLEYLLQKNAASIVTGKAESGLDEFIANAIKQVDAPKVFYGGYLGGVAAKPAGALMLEALKPNQNNQGAQAQ